MINFSCLCLYLLSSFALFIKQQLLFYYYMAGFSRHHKDIAKCEKKRHTLKLLFPLINLLPENAFVFNDCKFFPKLIRVLIGKNLFRI